MNALSTIGIVVAVVCVAACGSDPTPASSDNSGGQTSSDGGGSGGSPGSGGAPSSGGSTAGGRSSGGTAPDGGAASGGAASGGSSASGGAASGGSDAGPTGPGSPFRPRRFVLPDPPHVEGPCNGGGSGTASSTTVLVGQTHLVPSDSPLLAASASRALSVGVRAIGSGAAPAGSVTARLEGRSLVLCLEGPASLAAESADLGANLYRTAVPSEWVKPGLALDVKFGAMARTLEPEIRAENGVTLYLLHAALFGDGTPDETPDSALREYLGRLPFSHLDVSVDPFGTWRPKHLLIGARDDGRTQQGDARAHGPIVVDENPHCSAADKTASECTLHSGFATMSGVLQTLDSFRGANGVNGSSTWYASLARNLGGGLAGGQRGTGDDTGMTMNHELGHAFGFPHWAASHTDYPYEGVQRENGGFGDSWAINLPSSQLLSPKCPNGLERQSPMQRAGNCVPSGTRFDPHSDYESARLLRMNLGAAAELTGTVSYTGGTKGGGTRPFRLPKEGGRQAMVFDPSAPGFHFERYDEAKNAFSPENSTAWNRVVSAEVPVVMFSGGVIVDGPSFFEAPIEYVGNVLGSLDPSDAGDYAEVYRQRSSEFYWASDLSFRFTLDDGTSFYRLSAGGAELRVKDDYAIFAVNLPAALGARVKKLEVVSRPLGQYTESSRLTASVTAATYYQGARVLSTWER